MIDQRQFTELHKVYPAMAALPAALQQTLRQEGVLLKAPVGQLLFDLDGPCHSFVMVTAGSIRVTMPASNGREILLYRVQTGESCVLTVSCLMGQANYPARGVVENDLTAVAISQPLFARLVEQSAAFRAFIFRYFGERLAHLMTLVEEVAFHKLDQRVAALLLGRQDVIETTHQALADELGSVREVVSRVLKDMAARGVVRLERGQIHILNRAALTQIACPNGD
ncbi:MAG: Crp/Fnr family transcriptional regulator [Chloroflexota bacterium]